MLMPRAIATEVAELLRQFPAVCILGPRQAGKTTLARMALPGAAYWDLELPSDRRRMEIDPETALREAPAPSILDEAQAMPELFPILRAIIDEDRKRTGRFLILGSASPSLVRGLSESLAGRIGFLEIAPLSWREIHSSRARVGLTRRWQRGGFPDAILAASSKAWHGWMEGYTRTFIERDLASLGVDVNTSLLRRLCGMISHSHGNIWNASEMAGSLGVTYHTAQRYADIIEQTFLVRFLPPWFANIGKRLVKRPKIYWRDSGLLHYWLGITEREDILSHPKAGASWEGFILEEIINREKLARPESSPYFFRTSSGLECDLLLVRGKDQIPIEIKLASSIGREDAEKMKRVMALLKCDRGHFVCNTRQTFQTSKFIVWNAREMLASDPWSLK